jgi:hypothetical protein
LPIYFKFKGTLNAASAVLNASKRVSETSDEVKTTATIFYLLWPMLPIPVAARLLGLWFRIPPGALMSVVNVVCCQEVSALG